MLTIHYTARETQRMVSHAQDLRIATSEAKTMENALAYMAGCYEVEKRKSADNEKEASKANDRVKRAKGRMMWMQNILLNDPNASKAEIRRRQNLLDEAGFSPSEI